MRKVLLISTLALILGLSFLAPATLVAQDDATTTGTYGTTTDDNDTDWGWIGLLGLAGLLGLKRREPVAYRDTTGARTTTARP